MTPKPHAVVRAENLCYAYREKPPKDVLSHVSFEVGEGEFFVILGPNGSGKSTLMRLLSGIATARTGSLSFSGKPLSHYSRRERAARIACVPQILPDSFTMTCRDLVMSGRAPRQGVLGFESADDRRKVEEAMAFTETGGFRNRNIQRLSGGERQRVFIAAAIAQEPALMLLDEPVSSLDPAHQIRIMDLMERLKREKGATLVMVLHDINLAALYADTVLVLKNGRVFAQGPPSEALTLETLEAVYQCSFFTDRHPLLDVPRFSPVPGKCRTSSPRLLLSAPPGP